MSSQNEVSGETFLTELRHPLNEFETGALAIGLIGGALAGGAVAWGPEGQNNALHLHSQIPNLKKTDISMQGVEKNPYVRENSSTEALLKHWVSDNKHTISIEAHSHGPNPPEAAGTLASGALSGALLLGAAAVLISRFGRSHFNKKLPAEVNTIFCAVADTNMVIRNLDGEQVMSLDGSTNQRDIVDFAPSGCPLPKDQSKRKLASFLNCLTCPYSEVDPESAKLDANES